MTAPTEHRPPEASGGRVVNLMDRRSESITPTAGKCSSCGQLVYQLLDGYDICRGCGERLNPGRRLGETLDQVLAMLRTYVITPSEHEAHAITLWVAMTHLIDAFDTAIFLHIFSAEPESGKTRVLEFLDLLVNRPWKFTNPSAPTLFRMISARHPVLLWDEIDQLFRKGERDPGTKDLQAVVDAGHRRGGQVPRCVGEGRKQEVVMFDCFAAMALAGINQLRLPDTVRSRSIPIALRRRAPEEQVRKWREREARAMAEPIRAALESLPILLFDELQAARPDIPIELGDRAGDGWEALIALAEAAGGEWPTRARKAAVALNGAGRGLDASTIGAQLLADIRVTFEEVATDRISSGDLVDALRKIEGSPWDEWMTKNVLARKLKPYGIRPREIRIDVRTLRGYHLEDFADAFRRYLTTTETTETTETLQVAPTSDVSLVSLVSLTEGEEEAAPLAENPDDPATEMLVALHLETRGNWNRIARTISDAGFRSPAGEPWTGPQVRAAFGNRMAEHLAKQARTPKEVR